MTHVSPQAIGRKGEQIVHELLPGSVWANHVAEQRQYFDLEWEGIKIDVKTATERMRVKRGYIFTTNERWGKHVIFILVGLSQERDYYWVVDGFGVKTYCAKIKDAISAEDLPQKVREVYKILTTKKPLAEEIDKETYTVNEVAEILSVTPQTIKKWIKLGLLKAFQMRPRGQYRINRDILSKYTQL